MSSLHCTAGSAPLIESDPGRTDVPQLSSTSRRAALTRWMIVAWVGLVTVAYVIESAAYFQEKIRVFLPVLLGR